jgi:hypothetical protein
VAAVWLAPAQAYAYHDSITGHGNPFEGILPIVAAVALGIVVLTVVSWRSRKSRARTGSRKRRSKAAGRRRR